MMSKLTKTEVKTLIPYLENSVMAPKGLFGKGKGEIQLHPGAIIEYGDELTPANTFRINQTENLKALIELYKVVDKDGE